MRAPCHPVATAVRVLSSARGFRWSWVIHNPFTQVRAPPLYACPLLTARLFLFSHPPSRPPFLPSCWPSTSHAVLLTSCPTLHMPYPPYPPLLSSPFAQVDGDVVSSLPNLLGVGIPLTLTKIPRPVRHRCDSDLTNPSVYGHMVHMPASAFASPLSSTCHPYVISYRLV